MLTLAIATATSLVAELQRDPHPTAVLEIGGFDKTAEAAELNLDVAEAYDYNDLYCIDTYHLLLSQMRELKPKVLWIHDQDGSEPAHDRISSLGSLQIDLGGLVILEGDVKSRLWHNSHLRDLQAKCTTRISP